MMNSPSPAPAIETDRLCKAFGAIHAVDRISLRLDHGESLAVFGPNGAGKTTLIRLLTLNLRASSGSFSLDGLDPRRNDLSIRRKIGLISHQSFLYDDLSALENLEFFARLYGVERPRQRAVELLRTVDLEARSDDPVRTFSRGMQQRVSLARALVHAPRVVFLDEPFTGLDPHAARTLRATLEGLRRERRTVFMVTHNLSRGLELCDRWIVLSGGRIVKEGRSDQTDRQTFEREYFAWLDRHGPAGEPS